MHSSHHSTSGSSASTRDKTWHRGISRAIRSPGSWIWMLGWCALLGGAAFARGPFSFLCDDAFIALRYARNLAELGLPVYNANPVEWVEGYTSPLWVAGMAVLAVLGVDLEFGALAGCAIGAIATLALTGRIAAQLAGDDPGLRRWAAWLSGLCLVWVPQWFVWSSGGLETSCAAALGLAACDARLRSQHRRFYIWSILAALARLDSLVWIFAFTIADRFGGTRDRLVRSSALWLLVIAGHFLLRFTLYGEWLPQTWLVKRHGAQLASTWGLAYLQHWAWDGATLLLALPLLFGLRKWPSLVALVVANLSYAYAVGGDFMAYSRFLLPATCASAAGFAVACARAERYFVATSTSERKYRAFAMRVLSMLVPLFFALRWSDAVKKDRASSWLHGRFESVDAMEQFAAIRRRAGEAFALAWPESTRVTVGAAGAFPYGSRFQSYDAYGLVDPLVLDVGHAVKTDRARPGHVIYGGDRWATQRSPDLRCEIGWASPTAPSAKDLRRRVRNSRGLRWACVETGPVYIRTRANEPLRSHFYCCVTARSSAEQAP